MIKRGIIIGDYDTAVEKWTLSAWNFSEPVQETNYVAIPGRRKGPLDLSTVLTDGEPTYGSRTFTATLESSEGNRLDREARISTMVNQLSGLVWEIELPDDNTRYIVGRVKVERLYNDLAHGSVRVTAICEPWRYNYTETKVILNSTIYPQAATLTNTGKLAVAPKLVVAGSPVELYDGDTRHTLSAGTYILPGLLLKGFTKIEISYNTTTGSSTLTFTYREGIL